MNSEAKEPTKTGADGGGRRGYELERSEEEVGASEGGWVAAEEEGLSKRTQSMGKVYLGRNNRPDLFFPKLHLPA